MSIGFDQNKSPRFKTGGRTRAHLPTCTTPFSKALGYNSITNIQKAVTFGAVLNTDHFGLKERNVQTPKVDHLLTFYWGAEQPEDGGTKHTWTCAKQTASTSDLARCR